MNTEGVLDFQIRLEEQVSHIYQGIADQFLSDIGHETEWITFWKELAGDEANHASLLSIEKTFLQSGARFKEEVEVDPKVRAELDRLLSQCEKRVRSGMTEKDAIKVMDTLERSEFNQIFSSLLRAINSRVLNHFGDFSKVYKEHERRIQQAIRKYRYEIGPSAH
ncbi:MAG: hypothetical protein ACE5HN_00845 [Nitrospiria bacterium]